LRLLIFLQLILISLLLRLILRVVGIGVAVRLIVGDADPVVQIRRLRLLFRRGKGGGHAIGVDAIARWRGHGICVLRHRGRREKEGGKGNAADGQDIAGLHRGCSIESLADDNAGLRRPFRNRRPTKELATLEGNPPRPAGDVEGTFFEFARYCEVRSVSAADSRGHERPSALAPQHTVSSEMIEQRYTKCARELS
jgi:hypothetical protein